MTSAQNAKLNTIIGKIESLQSDLARGASQKEKDAMRVAKTRLMEIFEH